MNGFENRTVLSKKDIAEINTHIYLKTPLYIVLYIICILSIGARLVDYFVYNVVNLSATIPFLLALIAMAFVFAAAFVSFVASMYSFFAKMEYENAMKELKEAEELYNQMTGNK